ncbi:Cys-Gln thioester bond-forming surface protein [Kitasatospora sp. NPDC093550]|uniref:thioester domain-containing protein n=1 Tax=Kitasatospora sp. NPDC093550 TaxID=3364089 RepID=UPI00380A2C8A
MQTVRSAIAMLAGGILVGGTPMTAVAAEGGGHDGRIVITEGWIVESDYIAHVLEPEGKDDGLPGGLIKVATRDGGTLFAYCLDLRTPVKGGATYREDDWSEVPTLQGNPVAGKINWILQHSYPTVSETALGELTGGKLTKGAAAGGTQAAIWRLTNHVRAVPWDPAAATLADYLVTHAEEAEAPARPLTLAPDAVTGTSGSVLGPIGLTTTGDQAEVSLDPAAVAAGAALTDRDGTVLSDGGGKLTRPAKNGESLFLKTPAGARPGSATVSATASVPVRAGQALVSPDSQALALVRGDRIPVTAAAKASWVTGASPSPTATPSDRPSPSPTHSAAPTTQPTTPAPTATADPTTPGPADTPTAGGTTSAAPGVTAAPSSGVTPPGGAGGSALASTGAGSALGPLAVAGAGLIVTGGALALLRRRDRRRTGA